MPRKQRLSQQDRRARAAERNRTSRQAAVASADPAVLARLQNTRDRDRHRRATVAASTVPDVVAQRVRTRVSQTERQRIRRQAIYITISSFARTCIAHMSRI